MSDNGQSARLQLHRRRVWLFLGMQTFASVNPAVSEAATYDDVFVPEEEVDSPLRGRI
jgi:hypothetical protein